MENDLVRPFGDATLVDIWLDGRFRSITVTKHAIETYLMFSEERGALMTQMERCEFVRTHLRDVSRAAAQQVRAEPSKHKITIGPGEL